MKKRIDSVLGEVLKIKDVPVEDAKRMDSVLKKFLKDFEEQLKLQKVNADIFVGGSAAKGTMIKKDNYDIDIFLRFDKGYGDEDFSSLTKKVLDKIRGINFEIVHGSRDYFRISVASNLYFEIVPVKKIVNPKEARNITDLSYLHSNYIRKKIKSQKVRNDIKLAKAFCYARDCYGAESYINGFSGYGLELLIYHYGSFTKFAKELSKVGENKLIIDVEKFYKKKKIVLMDLNESKLQSPIILIDPTFKTRNVLAALSEETFRKFQVDLKKFLKSPKIEDFERVGVDFSSLEKEARKKRYEFVSLVVSTEKQEGDIAGSKLKKFYNHISEEAGRFFEIKKQDFEYPIDSSSKSARFFFSAKSKKELLIAGPSTDDLANVKRFRAKHKRTFVKGKKIYAREEIKFTLRDFLEGWGKKNVKKMKEMSVVGLDIFEG